MADKSMTSRQRVLTALNHKEPDRVPLDLGGLGTNMQVRAQDELKNYLGIKGETKAFVRQHAEPDEEILERFGIDTRYVRAIPLNKTELASDNSYVDDWGIKLQMPPSSHYYDVVEFPLANASSVSDLRNYDWPDPTDPRRVTGLKEKARHLFQNSNCAIVADAPQLGIFEMSWLLVGFEKFLIELSYNTNFVRYLLEKVTELEIALYDTFLSQVKDYIHVVAVSDDLGTQDNLIISPELYKSAIKPLHKKFWQFVKDKSNAYLYFHCCGSIKKLIPDFIELGVDILNPVQVSAADMDTKQLKQEFGHDITFWGGGCDTQKILPFGTPEDVKNEVKRRIGDLSAGGGFVFAPVHNIQPDVPPENIVAMYQTALKNGGYNLH